jgi:hypothetical protein
VDLGAIRNSPQGPLLSKLKYFRIAEDDLVINSDFRACSARECCSSELI